MKKSFYGIDFSINHTGICYKNDVLSYFTISRYKKFTKKDKKISDLLKNLSILYIDRSVPLINEMKNNYSYNEIEKLKDAIIITDYIANDIVTDKNAFVGIEGFSFASVGKRALELGGYQYLLRNKINLNKNVLNVYSPMTIKKVAGKGNFNKLDMLNAYIENSTNDILLDRCEMRKLVIDNYDIIVSKNKVIEPICGIIDSYWVMRTVEILSEREGSKMT